MLCSGWGSTGTRVGNHCVQGWSWYWDTCTEALCSGWGSTGTPVRKHCVQGGSVLGHMYGHTQGVESYLSVEKSRLECY